MKTNLPFLPKKKTPYDSLSWDKISASFSSFILDNYKLDAHLSAPSLFIAGPLRVSAPNKQGITHPDDV